MKLMQVNAGTGYLDSRPGLAEQADMPDCCLHWQMKGNVRTIFHLDGGV